MKKINFFGIELILLMIIFSSFALCVDFDGDGIDDGEQNLCGDSFCQMDESESSCPADCTGVSPGEQSIDTTTNTTTSQNTIPEEQNLSTQNDLGTENVSLEEETLSTTEGQPQQEISSATGDNFSENLFKIVSVVIILIIIAVIVFIILKKKKISSVSNSPLPAVNP